MAKLSSEMALFELFVCDFSRAWILSRIAAVLRPAQASNSLLQPEAAMRNLGPFHAMIFG